jgi:hypothetical protein
MKNAIVNYAKSLNLSVIETPTSYAICNAEAVVCVVDAGMDFKKAKATIKVAVDSDNMCAKFLQF